MLCPKCGSPMPDDGLFCGRCGHDTRNHTPEEKPLPASAPVSTNAAFGRATDLLGGEETCESVSAEVPAKTEPDDAALTAAETEKKEDMPVFSGRKRGVSKVYESPPAAVEPHREAETPVYTAPVSAPVYKPVMASKPKFNWKKTLAMVLVLALIVGGICWIVEADLFGGSSSSRKDRDDDDDKHDKDDDEDDDDHGGSHGQGSSHAGGQSFECSGLVIYLPSEFEVGYSYSDALYCCTDTEYVEVVCGPISDVDSGIRNASDFADYYEYQISGYYDYERGTKNGVPYILIYDEYYDKTLVYGFYVSGGYGWMTAAYCYGEGDVNTLIGYATGGEIESVPQTTGSYDDYYDDDSDYEDDYYEDDSYGEDYFDCSGCVNGRCGICMGDGDYAGVECKGCDGSGVCGLCDGLGIIFY